MGFKLTISQRGPSKKFRAQRKKVTCWRASSACTLLSARLKTSFFSSFSICSNKRLHCEMLTLCQYAIIQGLGFNPNYF
jgi:hypothetical protein